MRDSPTDAQDRVYWHQRKSNLTVSFKSPTFLHVVFLPKRATAPLSHSRQFTTNLDRLWIPPPKRTPWVEVRDAGVWTGRGTEGRGSTSDEPGSTSTSPLATCALLTITHHHLSPRSSSSQVAFTSRRLSPGAGVPRTGMCT